MKRVAYILFFLMAFLFFWETDIANRTEADDAFEYAWQIEQGGKEWLYHPHHLLFAAVTKDIYYTARLVGYSGRAYPLLRLISALCGAGSVLMFFQFCYRRFSMRPVSSLLCAGLLMFSYGFWRYANEAEVIVPACLIMLCSLYVAVSPGKNGKQCAVAGVFCGISVLFHVLNVVPVFLAVPLLYVLRRRVKGLLIHLLSAGVTVVAGYTGVYWLESAQVFSAAPSAPALNLISFFKGAVGFSQCVVSSNFMLGYPVVRETLVRLFPSRMLLEELYLGQAMPTWLVVSATVSFALLAACFIGVAGWAVVLIFQRSDDRRKRDRVGTVEGWRTLMVVVLWFAGYAGALLLLEPGNPEVWVMGLVPFWLAFCGLVVAPLSRQNVLWPVLLLAVLLAVHNYLGGMLPLKDPQADYNRQKSAWVLQHVRPGDVVLTAGNPVFERYLRYISPARVEYLHFWPDRRLRAPGTAFSEDVTGTIFVMGDVFTQPESLKKRFPAKTTRIAEFANHIRPFVIPVYSDSFGGGYILPDYLPSESNGQ